MTSVQAERRSEHRRREIAEHGIVIARIRPGHDVQLIDVSSTGALLETSRRLLPGASVELHIETCDRHASLRGCVIRCSVFRIRASSICYRGAIAFDHHLPWFVEIDGSKVPMAGPEAMRLSREAVTPQVI